MTHTEWGEEVRVLSRAVDQAGDVLDHVHRDALGRPTPCDDWDVAALADHLVDVPRQFLAAAQGQEVDWAADPPHIAEEWGPTFRVAGDDLVHAMHQLSDDAQVPADMQTAELALHTWDLAQAIGYTEPLDPVVAERGLAFLQDNLPDQARGSAFGPAREAPADAGVYERLAAYAGRSV